MKKSFISFILFTLSHYLIWSQVTDSSFQHYIITARKYAIKKDSFNSARLYSLAFNLNDSLPLYMYRIDAAKSWALCGNNDSAFAQIIKLVSQFGYNESDVIKESIAFKSLYADERWKKIVVLMNINEKKIDSILRKMIDSVATLDQLVRTNSQKIRKEKGDESIEYKKSIVEWEHADSLNRLFLDSIINKHGWLGNDKIGVNSSANFFLLLQHSNLERQLKYLPLFERAVKYGNANPDDLSLLVDRIALRTGRKQIYGSQFFFDSKTQKNYIRSIDDPCNVDMRRILVGLLPMEEYCTYAGIRWDLTDYIKQLPELEEMEKKFKQKK
jgi:hypothetical protein